MLGLLNKKPQVTNAPNANTLDVKSGEIAFYNVSFSYNANRPILNNISFKVKAGSKVAIVGASGAGKSSLARLLYRFYDVTSGSITIDNQAINSVTLDSLRKAIAIVPQDTVLFNTTIRENIAYGRPSASDSDIDKAIEMAHLKDFINTLADGDKTRVGERGLKVSGGEKQRIAIARAILKQSPILIFDEATSALDSQAEQAILKAMHEVASEHTSIVIAHRLSTITDAHTIIVLKSGQIVEQGQHNELLALGGEYAHMWALQQQD
jgi:ATP-binding cassette subfamily B protein